ncbi:g6207 [Coccomyxa viridis]|uniref:G6207 protein n=1 Tax=Coccomyxa viridis TaxID=1274662 RepID=A0ABP1FW54_9CHLO
MEGRRFVPAVSILSYGTNLPLDTPVQAKMKALHGSCVQMLTEKCGLALDSIQLVPLPEGTEAVTFCMQDLHPQGESETFDESDGEVDDRLDMLEKINSQLSAELEIMRRQISRQNSQITCFRDKERWLRGEKTQLQQALNAEQRINLMVNETMKKEMQAIKLRGLMDIGKDTVLATVMIYTGYWDDVNMEYWSLQTIKKRWYFFYWHVLKAWHREIIEQNFTPTALRFLEQTWRNRDIAAWNLAAHALNVACWSTRGLLLEGMDEAETNVVKFGARDIYRKVWQLQHSMQHERAVVASHLPAP